MVGQRVQAKLAVKDEYTFDFAELSPEYSEHELEVQLVNNIRSFLIEMGGDYTFIGNQYHLMAGNRDVYKKTFKTCRIHGIFGKSILDIQLWQAI